MGGGQHPLIEDQRKVQDLRSILTKYIIYNSKETDNEA